MSRLVIPPLTHVQKWLLAGVIALALILRAWGLDFGLPYTYHPDEPNYVPIALRMARTGDLNPHFFNFPSFLFDLNALAYAPYLLISKWAGIQDIAGPRMQDMAVGFTAQPTTFLLGRALTMLLGLATVWLVFLSSRGLNGDAWSALLAAFLAAISPTSVVHSHFITPDVPQLFWIALALWGAVSIYRQGKAWHYAIAGLAVGAAASTKYNGVLALAPVLLAHFMRYGNDMNSLFAPKLYLTLLSSAAAFFAITPYAILDTEAFLKGLTYESRHYAQGHLGMEGHTPSWYLAYLWRIEGPVIVLAVLAIAQGLRQHPRDTILLGVFPTLYYLFVNCFMVRNDRTILPILPFVAILASWWLVGLFKKEPRVTGRLAPLGMAVLLLILSIILPAQGIIKTDFYLYHPDSAISNVRAWLPAPWFLAALTFILAVLAFMPLIHSGTWQRRARMLAGGLLTVAVCGLPLAQIVRADSELAVVDGRETARAWIRQNLPGGARIALEAYAPYVDPDRFWVEGVSRMIEHPAAWYVEHEFDYLVFSQRTFMRFYRDPEMYKAQVNQYEKLFAAFGLIKTFNDGGFEVRIYCTSSAC